MVLQQSMSGFLLSLRDFKSCLQSCGLPGPLVVYWGMGKGVCAATQTFPKDWNSGLQGLALEMGWEQAVKLSS